MKKAYVLFILFAYLLFTENSNAQVNIQSLTLFVKCCGDSDSVDVFNDGIYDIKIIGDYFAVDLAAFKSKAINNNIEIAAPVDSGFQFSGYGQTHTITHAVFCFWSASYWIPNTGYKYEGFRVINAPNDTTYGWVKLNFLGPQQNCHDTIIAIELAYNTTSNVPIIAGQKSTVGINYLTHTSSITVSPNPITDKLNVIANNTELSEIVLYDITSRKLLQRKFTNSASISTVLLEKGIYLYEVRSENGFCKKGKLVKD